MSGLRQLLEIFMRRAEVWWVNFDPSLGGEIRKKRPAVIISNDISNKYLNRLQVVPITSKTDRLYPSEAYITIKGTTYKAMTDQLTMVSKLRLFNRIELLSNQDMLKIVNAVKTQLDLS